MLFFLVYQRLHAHSLMKSLRELYYIKRIYRGEMANSILYIDYLQPDIMVAAVANIQSIVHLLCIAPPMSDAREMAVK